MINPAFLHCLSSINIRGGDCELLSAYFLYVELM